MHQRDKCFSSGQVKNYGATYLVITMQHVLWRVRASKETIGPNVVNRAKLSWPNNLFWGPSKDFLKCLKPGKNKMSLVLCALGSVLYDEA